MERSKKPSKRKSPRVLLAMLMALALLMSLAITPAMAADVVDENNPTVSDGSSTEGSDPVTGGGTTDSGVTPTTPGTGEGGDKDPGVTPTTPGTGEGGDKDPGVTPTTPGTGEGGGDEDPDVTPTTPGTGEGGDKGDGDNTDPSDPGKGDDPATTEPPKEPVKVEVAVGDVTSVKDGDVVKATASIDDAAPVASAIVTELEKAENADKKVVSINIDVAGKAEDEGQTAVAGQTDVTLAADVVTTLKDAVTAQGDDGKAIVVTVKSDTGTVQLPVEALEKVQGNDATKSVTLAVGVADTTNMTDTETVKAEDGTEVTAYKAVDSEGKALDSVVLDEHVVIVDVTLKAGDNAVSVAGLVDDIQITVSAPAGADYVDVYYVNDAGKLVLVESGVEVKGGDATFGVNHLTEFVINKGEALVDPDDPGDDNPGTNPGGNPGVTPDDNSGGGGTSVNTAEAKAQAIVNQAKRLRLNVYELDVKAGDTYAVRLTSDGLSEALLKGWKMVKVVSSDPSALVVESIAEDGLSVTVRGVKTGAKVTLTVELSNAALDQLIKDNSALAKYGEQVKSALEKTMKISVTVVDTETRVVSTKLPD